MTEEAAAAPIGNRFDRMEIAWVFGDMGTLIPLVVSYLAVLKMDPCGVLFSFGIAMLVCGLVYRTPIPVQPMTSNCTAAATCWLASATW
jgi:Molybdate transporter of MFS superfamily